MRTGQTLIEVLIAFAVTVVIGVGLVTVGLATQKSAVGARNEAQATKLAQDYMEKIRILRDGVGWNQFVVLMGSSGLSSGGAPNEDEFIIKTPSSDVNAWTLDRIWSANAPCLQGQRNNFSPPNLILSDVMSGEKLTVGKVDYCVRIIIRGTYGGIRVSAKTEVSWKEGSNVRTSRAETVISKWCATTIDANNPVTCPNE